MIKLSFGDSAEGPATVLCLGAHCDDIEIGCGGAVLRLLDRYPQAKIWWIVFSGNDLREQEARASAGDFLKAAQDPQVMIKRFRNGFFPSVMADIKEFFEELKGQVSPDLIFTHFRDDLHQDHRTIAELTWNTFRDHMILEYEIPKYDGGLGSPNVFVPLDDAHRMAKVQSLMSRFASQRDKPWFTPETFDGLARLRGVECNAPSGYAEAFYCRKAVF